MNRKVKAKEQFFKYMANQGLALTFDDVRLRTSRSSVPAAQVKIESRFSKNVALKVPIASAAMDTVTTADMAIGMAKLGGIGVIHAGLPMQQQKTEVRKVKLHLNGLIEKPVTVRDDQSVASVVAMCEDKKFEFRTFPVIDSKQRLVGLLTQNDFDFYTGTNSTVGKIMTPLKDMVSAGSGTSIKSAYKTMKKHKKKTLPLVDKDGKVAGLYVLSDVLRIINDNPEQYNLDDNGRLRVAAAVPTSDEALQRVREMRKYLDVAVVDTAQGDSDFALATLQKLKQEFPDLDVVVGNVSEAASALALAKAGADGIKVGQGPGSICTTRTETGIGCPQVTAVYECAQAVEAFNVPICADGGIREPGDISIAIAAGASSVMMGGRLAGTNEAPGEKLVLDSGQVVKLYRGMGSPSAMNDSAASRLRYDVSDQGEPLSEGIESYIPYQGSVLNVMDHYIKALRKSLSYVGAPNIEIHRRETIFWRITNAGIRESHPHDVKIMSRYEN